MNRRHDERGLAMVEAPLCIVVILLLLMGVITITQVIWTHLDLAEAARDTVRYAARVEYDPVAGTSSRHRTAVEVEAWATKVAHEACGDGECTVSFQVCSSEGVDCGTPPVNEDDAYDELQGAQTGDLVTVTITRTVSNPLFDTAAGITNAMAGLLNLGQPFDLFVGR